MNIEKQVASLELSKRLKELGVGQESEFGWYKNVVMYQGERCFGDDYRGNAKSTCSAFTVAELLEDIPASINGNSMFVDRFNNLWLIGYANVYEDDKPFAPTLADACAELKIWLIENKLV